MFSAPIHSAPETIGRVCVDPVIVSVYGNFLMNVVRVLLLDLSQCKAFVRILIWYQDAASVGANFGKFVSAEST